MAAASPSAANARSAVQHVLQFWGWKNYVERWTRHLPPWRELAVVCAAAQSVLRPVIFREQLPPGVDVAAVHPNYRSAAELAGLVERAKTLRRTMPLAAFDEGPPAPTLRFLEWSYGEALAFERSHPAGAVPLPAVTSRREGALVLMQKLHTFFHWLDGSEGHIAEMPRLAAEMLRALPLAEFAAAESARPDMTVATVDLCRRVLGATCPTAFLGQKRGRYAFTVRPTEVLAAAKLLRHQLQVDELATCRSCARRAQCPQVNVHTTLAGRAAGTAPAHRANLGHLGTLLVGLFDSARLFVGRDGDAAHFAYAPDEVEAYLMLLDRLVDFCFAHAERMTAPRVLQAAELREADRAAAADAKRKLMERRAKLESVLPPWLRTATAPPEPLTRENRAEARRTARLAALTADLDEAPGHPRSDATDSAAAAGSWREEGEVAWEPGAGGSARAGGPEVVDIDDGGVAAAPPAAGVALPLPAPVRAAGGGAGAALPPPRFPLGAEAPAGSAERRLRDATIYREYLKSLKAGVSRSGAAGQRVLRDGLAAAAVLPPAAAAAVVRAAGGPAAAAAGARPPPRRAAPPLASPRPPPPPPPGAPALAARGCRSKRSFRRARDAGRLLAAAVGGG